MKISKKQLERLERVLDLADELCVAVDLAADDIGGSRPINEILRDLGPAVDDAQDHQRKRPTLAEKFVDVGWPD